MSDAQITIGRVRARCGEEWEPARVRLRLSHLLSTADFQPSGLPPRAILLIRRVQVARPLDLEQVRVSREWEQALRAETTSLLQHAARPYRGIVPADAPAALFADEAELLACLSLWLVRPAPELLWIWQAGVSPRIPFLNSEELTRRLCRSARAVPAALELLAQWDDMRVPFLAALSESQVEAIFQTVAFEFGLSVTCRELSFPNVALPLDEGGANREEAVNRQGATYPTGTDRSVGVPSRPHEQNTGDNSSQVTPEVTRLPAWLGAIERSGSRLTPSAQALLLLTAAIHRAPTLPHAAQSLQALSQYAAQRRQESATDEKTYPQEAGPLEYSAREDTRSSAVASPGVETETTPAGFTSADDMSQPSGVASNPLDQASRQEARVLEPDAAESSPAVRSVILSQSAPWNGLEGIRIRLGGAFYLLNLFLRLDAPACFDARFACSEHLTRWGLVQLLAQYLLSHEANTFAVETTDYADDPLWPLLARLDGRLPEAPVAPHLPDRTQTLQIVLESLRARLANALNGAQEAAMLRVPTIVYVTRVHLDVVMSLQHISLPARIAGLDANPGWMPDLLRVVAFHFE